MKQIKIFSILTIIILSISCTTASKTMKCKFKVDDCIKVNPDRFPKTMYQSGIPFKVVDIDKKLYILRGLHPDFEGLNIKLLHEYVETKFFKSSCKIGKESPKEVK